MNLHNATLGESGVGLVERLFNRDGWQVGGGSSIVDATSWNAAEGYEVTAAPSMRMVVSLADFDDSRWINLTGVSGHPASSHYSDQTELYVDGQTLPWAFSREAVEAATEDRLVLDPGVREPLESAGVTGYPVTPTASDPIWLLTVAVTGYPVTPAPRPRSPSARSRPVRRGGRWARASPTSSSYSTTATGVPAVTRGRARS